MGVLLGQVGGFRPLLHGFKRLLSICKGKAGQAGQGFAIAQHMRAHAKHMQTCAHAGKAKLGGAFAAAHHMQARQGRAEHSRASVAGQHLLGTASKMEKGPSPCVIKQRRAASKHKHCSLHNAHAIASSCKTMPCLVAAILENMTLHAMQQQRPKINAS